MYSRLIQYIDQNNILDIQITDLGPASPQAMQLLI